MRSKHHLIKETLFGRELASCQFCVSAGVAANDKVQIISLIRTKKVLSGAAGNWTPVITIPQSALT